MNKTMIKVRELATILEVTPQMLYQRISANKLKAIQNPISKQIVLKIADLPEEMKKIIESNSE